MTRNPAATVTPAASRRQARRAGAGTLVLLLLAVASVASVMACANKRVIEQSKQKRTMADMRSFALGVESYGSATQTFPMTAGLADVAAQLEPTYIAAVPRVDGWGNELRYQCLRVDQSVCMEYAIQSAAKDGVFETLPTPISKRVAAAPEWDILWVNGEFVWYPEGRLRP